VTLSRGCFAGAGRHRTSTTRACVHEGLLLMRRADCILEPNLLASKNDVRKSSHVLSERAFLPAFPLSVEQGRISRKIISLCLRVHCRQFKNRRLNDTLITRQNYFCSA